MNEKQNKSISKFLSLILRHSPETIGIKLDPNGWADVEELLAKSAAHSHSFSRQELEEVVATNDKKRFSFNEGATKIRASQGHSVEVELNLATKIPPEFLYHGTVERFLENIKKTGLVRRDRHHVHLSQEVGTAEKVGNRRGEAVILRIRSRSMSEAGFIFYLSENGVWLTDEVPAAYIEFDVIEG